MKDKSIKSSITEQSITNSLYNKDVIEIIKQNRDYLISRESEKECNEHGIVRYDVENNFIGCILCDQDRKIGDEIMKVNIREFVGRTA